MDIRRFVVTQKRKHTVSDDSADEDEVTVEFSQPAATTSRQAGLSKLSYKKEWEQKYPWVSCTNVEEGMFCTFCQKSGNSPITARGAWTSRGIKDWNHATEQLKLHSQSKWHRDSVVYVRMSEQGEKQSVIQIYSAAAAKEEEERRQRNRATLLKLLRSIYFLAKHRMPLTTLYNDLVKLQIENGDMVLKQHIKHGPQNAQCTSNFSAVTLLEAIDTWLEQRLLQSLRSAPTLQFWPMSVRILQQWRSFLYVVGGL